MFANSALMTRFMLRRERVVSTVWVLMLALVVVGLVMGMDAVLDYEGRVALLPMLEMPALVSMMGPAYATMTDATGEYYTTFGALYTNFMMLFTALTVGIMNIFLVVRHTRADEERGRYEVIRSLPLGRLANLNAAMLTAVMVNVLLAIVVGLGIFAVGGTVSDNSICFNGSMLWGAALGATGLVFAAIAALFAQLSSSARGAISYSFIALAVFYMLRAPGDANVDLEFVSLLSPLGLVLRTQAFIVNAWWPIFIMLGTAAAICALAFYFNAVRDIDQGIIPAKAGRATGGILMKGSFGLASKLLKTSLIAWVIGMFVLAGTYGLVLGEMDDFIANNEMYQLMILQPAGIDVEALQGLEIEERVEMMHSMVAAAGFTITELFASMMNSMMGMAAMIPLIAFIMKVKSEETDGRTENLFATPLCRVKYFFGYVVYAFVGAVLIQLALALGMYTMGMAVLEDASELSLSFLLTSNLVYIPALWVKTGVAVLLVGAFPKASKAIWAYFGFSFLVVFLGRMIPQAEYIAWLSPFDYVPQLPMDEINWVVLAVMTVIAVGLTAAGLLLYRRRDINAITH